MIRNLPRSAASLLAIAALASVASADTVVFDQPSTFPNAFNFYTSDYGLDGGSSRGFRTFDNFRLDQTATLSSITFQIVSWDYLNPPNNPIPPDTTTWELAIYADAAFLPGAQLYSQSQPVAAAQVDFVSFAVLGGGETVGIYDVTLEFAGAFTAVAGTDYWISPFSLSPTFNPIIGWMSSFGMDDVSFQQVLGDGQVVVGQDYLFPDRAFTLRAVPEPATCLMSGLGLVALGSVVRRRSAHRPA